MMKLEVADGAVDLGDFGLKTAFDAGKAFEYAVRDAASEALQLAISGTEPPWVTFPWLVDTSEAGSSALMIKIQLALNSDDDNDPSFTIDLAELCEAELTNAIDDEYAGREQAQRFSAELKSLSARIEQMVQTRFT